MSLAADAKIVWGGAEAVRAISLLPRREHCVEIIFGPKYSIGMIGRKQLEDDAGLDSVVAAFVRDVAIFDQRACSAPQTIFVERNSRRSLREIGEMFARHFARLAPKPALDAYTTMQILNVRAQWAIDESKDVIASPDGGQLDGVHGPRAVAERSRSIADHLPDRGGLLAGDHSPVGAEGADRGHRPGRSRRVARFRRGRHAGRRGPLRTARHYEQLRVPLGRQNGPRATRPLGHAEAVKKNSLTGSRKGLPYASST